MSITKNRLLAFFAFFALFSAAAFAGTTDTLGLGGMWTTVSGWTTDGNVTKLIGVMFIIVGLQRAFVGQFLQLFFMMGLSLLIININSIVGTLFTAII